MYYTDTLKIQREYTNIELGYALIMLNSNFNSIMQLYIDTWDSSLQNYVFVQNNLDSHICISKIAATMRIEHSPSSYMLNANQGSSRTSHFNTSNLSMTHLPENCNPPSPATCCNWFQLHKGIWKTTYSLLQFNKILIDLWPNSLHLIETWKTGDAKFWGKV